MFIVPSKQKEKIDALMQQSIFGFTMSKLDWIQQVKNISAVLVRTYAPDIVPIQTGRIWVDTVGGKSYIATWTWAVSDRSILWNIWWSVSSGMVAVGNWWGLTSYWDLTYTSATSLLYTKVFDAFTEYRVWGVKVVWSRQSASYTANAQWSAYSGIDNSQTWSAYAQVSDMNTLRIAYESLRVWYENLRSALQTHGLIS